MLSGLRRGFAPAYQSPSRAGPAGRPRKRTVGDLLILPRSALPTGLALYCRQRARADARRAGRTEETAAHGGRHQRRGHPEGARGERPRVGHRGALAGEAARARLLVLLPAAQREDPVVQDRPRAAAVALLRLRRGGRRVRLRHEDRGPFVSRGRAAACRARPHRDNGVGRASGRRRRAQGAPQGRVRRGGRVLPCPAHAQPRPRRVGGAQLPGRARAGRGGAENLAARVRSGARQPRAASCGGGVHRRGDAAGQRGARRQGRRQAARPLLQPRDVPHPRPAGRLHRLRRARGGRGRAEVPELAGDAAVPQVAGALRPGQGEGGHGRHGDGGGLRGLHRRHHAARGGDAQRGGDARHGAHDAPYPAALAPCPPPHRVPVRRRRGRPARRRQGARLHRRLHDARGRQEPHRAGGRHAARRPRSGRVRGLARRR